MKQISELLILSVFILAAGSCKKEYDCPPLKEVDERASISIRKLKERVPPGISYSYKFGSGDTNLYCLVTCDEQSGNFYQQVFVNDSSGAIQLNLKESGGLHSGDRIRINLNTAYLICANAMIFLDSIDVVKNVVKLSSGNPVIPKSVSLDEVLTGNTLQSQLVSISDAEFRPNNLVPTFADAISRTSVNQTLTTCTSGNMLTLRTSGRASFAGKTLPKGNGTIIGIVSQYNSGMQLSLRNYEDAMMHGPLCGSSPGTITSSTYLIKDFNDMSISSGGWTNYSVINASVNWNPGTSSLTTSAFAKISGYVSGNTYSENWLLSPPVDLAGAKDPVLSFRTAAKFSGTALEVLVSSNYSSGDPNAATWTSLAPGYSLSPSSGDYLWTFSGNVSLKPYKSSTTRIAFRYKSTSSGASSYQLDDILVKEK